MAAILPNSIFVHIPKTGGTFVRRTIKDLGLYRGEAYEGNNNWTRIQVIHLGIGDIQSNKLTFAFVRNPTTWLQSKWTNMVRRFKKSSKPSKHLWKNDCFSKDFGEFVRKVLDLHPNRPTIEMNNKLGYEVVYDKCQPKKHHVDLIGKNESLREDLIRILNTAGEEFDENTILNKEEQRVASRSRNWACQYPPGLEDKVIDANLPFAKAFGYF